MDFLFFFNGEFSTLKSFLKNLALTFSQCEGQKITQGYQ